MATGMRLSIPASRVAAVARAAHVSEATVLRYRQTRGDGSPAHGLHDASLYLIEQAARGLPPDPQLDLIQGSQQYPREPLLGGQPATSCDHSPVPEVSVVTTGNAPLSLAGESASVKTGMARSDAREPASKPAPRPRLVLELPPGVEPPEPDGRHWYEERETA